RGCVRDRFTSQRPRSCSVIGVSYNHAVYGIGEPRPRARALLKRSSAGCGQRVHFPRPLAFHSPLALHQPLPFQGVERRIERALLAFQGILTATLDFPGDTIAMERAA